MTWGVFQIYEDWKLVQVEVAPTDGDGNLQEGHVLGRDCPCMPAQDEDNPELYIHREIH